MKKIPVEWIDEMSVGVDILDKDHQKLFSLLKQLCSLNEGGGLAETLSDVVSELYEYTDYHFRREEMVMEVCGYPLLDSHRRDHEIFAANIKRFLETVSDGADDYTVNSLSNFLAGWLRDHIMGMDKKYESWTAGKEKEINQVNLDFEANNK